MNIPEEEVRKSFGRGEAREAYQINLTEMGKWNFSPQTSSTMFKQHKVRSLSVRTI